MEKLWSLIEKRGVVFVSFKDEVLALAQVKTGTKIFRDASDEERRIKSGEVENPGEHGGGCRFAMRSSYYKNFLAAKEFVVKQLRQRAKRDALVENILEFAVAARDGVANHHQFGFWLKILCVEGLRYGNT